MQLAINAGSEYLNFEGEVLLPLSFIDNVSSYCLFNYGYNRESKKIGNFMELKYVGDMPIVSKHGVSFDHTQVDKYTYLTAAVELLEALSYGPTETTQHLYNSRGDEYSASELLELLKKFCKNIDELFDKRHERANELVHGLVDRVEDNDSLTNDERKAWLNNIDMMRDYYLQYITNSSAYECALEALSEEIHIAKVKEVIIPLFRNYGMVLSDLTSVLEARKSPIDSDMEVKTTSNGLIGIVKFSHR